MDFDYEEMEDFNEQEEENPLHSSSDEGGSAHDISFRGQIDDIYDPKINDANDRLVKHTEDLLHAKNSDDAQLAIKRIREDRHSADFWEDSKRSALNDSKKNEIFLEDINAKLEIIEKYRK